MPKRTSAWKTVDELSAGEPLSAGCDGAGVEAGWDGAGVEAGVLGAAGAGASVAAAALAPSLAGALFVIVAAEFVAAHAPQNAP